MKFVSILIALVAQLLLLVSTAFAHPGDTLVVDKQGRVYFGDVLHNTVWKIEGRKITPFVKDKHSHRVALDEQGNLFGEHLEYVPSNDTWRFHMWGNLSQMSFLSAILVAVLALGGIVASCQVTKKGRNY